MAIYPTWQRYTKLWKTVILPDLRKYLHILSIEKYTHEEEYLLTIKEDITDQLIDNVINQIKYSLESKDYIVDKWQRSDESDLSIQGKDNDMWAPSIEIAVFEDELYDDEILEWDDARWNDAGDDFEASYKSWISDLGLVDKYESIWDAPKKVQRAYCDWVRANNTDNKLWVRIIPVNM